MATPADDIRRAMRELMTERPAVALGTCPGCSRTVFDHAGCWLIDPAWLTKGFWHVHCAIDAQIKYAEAAARKAEHEH